MEDHVDADSLALAERVVLLTVADLALRGETPTHAGEVIVACTDRLDAVEGDVLGSLSEAAVARALNALEAADLVAEVRTDDTTAVGKGRPFYGLDVDPSTLLDALADDDRVTPLLERVRAAAEERQ